uniref:AlNc14C213G8967 protein n=1 Tax=Albugo laibachii Nc14 TaxID=890382 RepID=F0WRG4_9STRA|nr:AlNc14C213G8967 [Albugo laibachii Nc14]|eukprot:CCA23927.1 AlNc14C213G8967 [Albugo laibachii Nc14]
MKMLPGDPERNVYPLYFHLSSYIAKNTETPRSRFDIHRYKYIERLLSTSVAQSYTKIGGGIVPCPLDSWSPFFCVQLPHDDVFDVFFSEFYKDQLFRSPSLQTFARANDLVERKYELKSYGATVLQFSTSSILVVNNHSTSVTVFLEAASHLGIDTGIDGSHAF